MKLRPISLYSVVTAFFNHQYFMLQSWATMITIANKLVSSILFSGYINNNIWHLHIAFFATGPGLGLIMYLLTTLEFPTQYCLHHCWLNNAVTTDAMLSYLNIVGTRWRYKHPKSSINTVCINVMILDLKLDVLISRRRGSPNVWKR